MVFLNLKNISLVASVTIHSSNQFITWYCKIKFVHPFPTSIQANFSYNSNSRLIAQAHMVQVSIATNDQI